MAITDEQRAFLSRIKPVDLLPISCADCIPDVESHTITHADTCPVSIDIERSTAADARWFEDHPGAPHYYRLATWGEGAQLMLIDEKLRSVPDRVRLTIGGRVRVEQHEPGVRVRSFNDVYFVSEV